MPTVRFFVDSWEIECCAPPPEVGRETSWWMLFEPGRRGPDGLLGAEHQVRAGPADGRVVVDDVADAFWHSERLGPPPREPAVLAGLLVGTAHGPLPDELRALTGRVERVRLLRTRVAVVPDRWSARGRIESVPGTAALVAVRAAPRWFDSPKPAPGETESRESGVLVDVAVPEVRGSDT